MSMSVVDDAHSRGTAPVQDARYAAMRWWHHFMAAGSLTLLYEVFWLNAVGGALFGLGLAWWVVGRPYEHSLRAWLGS